MTPRQFAIQVVQKLQAAGFEALWAGGCVRDQLLGREPKDYDVATNARPDDIQRVFGEKKTLAIGAAFGVITVLGPRSAGQVEVATFRRDAGYSDGRHPDSVEFTDAREDAIRRDFTINGMFFDPLAESIHDYVDGQVDLERKRIRAIGNPHERIAEDKLRMLRAIRFAATFEFELESETLSAIREHAAEIDQVSPERIGAELIRMLSHPGKVMAARLLLNSELIPAVLPLDWKSVAQSTSQDWQPVLDELDRLEIDDIEASVFLLFRKFLDVNEIDAACSQLQSAWRLTNLQCDTINWLAKNWERFLAALSRPWSEIQPLLTHDAANQALAICAAIQGPEKISEGVEFCRLRLGWSSEKLCPAPLIDGKDLIELGIKPGPTFKSLLQAVRDRQLDGQLLSKPDAIQFVLTQHS